MPFIVKHSTLLRVLSLLIFVVVGLNLQITDDFVIHFAVFIFIFVFGLFQLLISIIENHYYAINYRKFIHNTIYRIIHFLVLIFVVYIVFYMTSLYTNQFVVFSLFIFAVLTGMYIDHRDDKNTHPKTKGVSNE